jgi:6-phosphogluconolactonase
VANYVGGNIAVLPVNADGSLGKAIDLEQHQGSGPDKTRQEAAHAHSIMLDPGNKYAFVNDLGIDRIMIYEFDLKNGKLAPNPKQPFYQTKPGAGPRHFKIHPAGKYAFAVNELDMTVTSLGYDQLKGTLKEIQTISAVPAGFAGENTCADIHISPNGRFLYASNRGHDSIVAYRIVEASGRLELIEHVSTQGKTPRNFTIDPTGKFMLVANQRSNSIATFSIDQKSGRLKYSGHTISVPSPVCLQLI